MLGKAAASSMRTPRAGWSAILLAPLLLLACSGADALDWELDVDARAVSSDGERSVVDGGLGTLRYDSAHSGLQLGRARFAVSETLWQVWSIRLDASAWGDHDRNPIDLTEAYLQFRPYPFEGYRLRIKAGAFHAPISLENRASGWESPYTLSYSAINTWLGEELRTIGVEGQMDWLGTRTGHGFDLGVTGGLFDWNEGAGAALATRGFALDDRQTTLFGRVGSTSGPLPPLELFREIDGRTGYYAGLEGRYLDRVVLRFMHYDNRADPGAYDSALQQYAWQTHFNSAGVRVETETGWTAIAQWLDGETYIEPPNTDLGWPFQAQFALLSKQIRAHRLSLRYDSFDVDSEARSGRGVQHGHAWTAAYAHEAGEHWRLGIEWLRVWSDASNRTLLLGAPAYARETQLQLSVKYSLESHIN